MARSGSSQVGRGPKLHRGPLEGAVGACFGSEVRAWLNLLKQNWNGGGKLRIDDDHWWGKTFYILPEGEASWRATLIRLGYGAC